MEKTKTIANICYECGKEINLKGLNWAVYYGNTKYQLTQHINCDEEEVKA
jgi:hypothetical protein